MQENGGDIGNFGCLRSRKDRDVWTPGIVEVRSVVTFEDEAILGRNERMWVLPEVS